MSRRVGGVGGMSGAGDGDPGSLQRSRAEQSKTAGHSVGRCAHCPSAPQRRVKPLEILQGKWLGHPLHPAVVHVPLALWIAAAALDILIMRDVAVAVLTRLSLYCVIGGMLGALVAVPTGIAEWVPIKKDKPAWTLALYHLVLNVVVVMLFAVNLVLRLQRFDERDGITPSILATSVIGALLLMASGYIGSLMVFDHGVSVGRLSKKKWRTIAARAESRLPDEKES